MSELTEMMKELQENPMFGIGIRTAALTAAVTVHTATGDGAEDVLLLAEAFETYITDGTMP